MAHILIVEDYPSLELLYRTVLEDAGYIVTVAVDGEEALKLATQRDPDLILLDLLLPVSGGLEFLRAYDLAKHPKVKVIVISNMSSPELAKDAKALGASQYLMKAKYTPKELAEVVTKALAAESPAS